MLTARLVLEQLVLKVHRRNGGTRIALDFETELLGPELGLDSLDLAEVMVEVERRYGVSPFEQTKPPRVWKDVVDLLEQKSTAPPTCNRDVL